jgi:hypothetical protein
MQARKKHFNKRTLAIDKNNAGRQPGRQGGRQGGKQINKAGASAQLGELMCLLQPQIFLRQPLREGSTCY